jgi:Uncharacterized protein conserved in bacteria (DUF2188)
MGRGQCTVSVGRVTSRADSHATKPPAVVQVRKLATRNKSELVIHNQDGKIGERLSYGNDPFPPGGRRMTTRGNRGIGGITTGGVIVIVGIVVAIFWSLILGIIIALIGLVAFGGFVRGRWY